MKASLVFKLIVIGIVVAIVGTVRAAPASSANSKMNASAKQECEQLMDSVLSFADKMLREYGEFLPFGGTIDASGKIGMSGAWTGEEHPPSNDVIGALQAGFLSGAREGKYIATALVYDVRVVPPGENTKTDAIAVDVSHREGISQTVIYPYRLENRQLIVGKPYAIGNQHPVF